MTTKINHTDQIQLRREFTQNLNLRRQVYRELTSYHVFPLQEMAIEDHFEKMKECVSSEDSNSSDGCVSVTKSLTDASPCSIVPPGNAIKKSTNETAAALNSLRNQYIQEFTRETRGSSSVVACALFTDLSAKEVSSTRDVENGPKDFECQEQSATLDSNTNYEQCVSEIDDISLLEEAQQYNNITRTEKKEMHAPKMLPLIKNELHQSGTTKKTTSLSTLWSMEPRLFALESSGSGKRRYISSHLGRFMDHYWRECDVYNRHYYELIRESTPCRLYFDLEFNKVANEEITQEIAECVLTELFEEIKHQFETLYKITIERHCLIDLDSSTNTKFSRHWIFHLPNGQLFSDAYAVGIFVKLLTARLDAEKELGLLQSRGHKMLAKHIFVNTESDCGDVKLTRFIDLGVYTRNRLFRLMGSTKFGKRPDAALRIASANRFPFPEEFSNSKFYLPEMKASVEDDKSESNSNEVEIDTTEVDFEQFCKSHNWEEHAAALEQTLVVPAHVRKENYPLLPDPEVVLGDDSQQKSLLESFMRNRAGKNSSISVRPTCSHGKSPLSKLDDFVVNTLGRRKGLVGSISTFSLDIKQPLPTMISYNMVGNRWCENVGRAHRSNNIIWNVHLMDRVCWQCCHDPECRGFRGEEIDLPAEVNVEIDEYFLERELSTLCIDNAQAKTACEEEFDDSTLEPTVCNAQIRVQEHQSAVKAPEEREFDEPTLDEAMKNLEL